MVHKRDEKRSDLEYRDLGDDGRGRDIMARHITDRDRSEGDGQRLQHFLRIERQAGRHPSAMRLHAAPRGASGEGSRLMRFLSIVRGRTV
jgi:hypothetical protein